MGKLYVGDSVGVIGVPVEVPKEKIGVTIDTFIGDVVDGVLKRSTNSSKRYEIDGSGITIIDNSALDYAFYDNNIITSVSFPDLEEIKDYGMNHAFYNDSNITTINFDKLKKIGDRGLLYAFSYISARYISFPSLEEVKTSGFQNCFSSLNTARISFDKLSKIGNNAFNNAFASSKYVDVLFPNVKFENLNETELQFNAMFANASNNIVHFPTNLQFVLKDWTQFSKAALGSTNMVVFDLPNVEEFPTINIVASQDVVIYVNGIKTNVVSAPINTQLTIHAKKERHCSLELNHVISESCVIELTDDMFIPAVSELNINYNNINDNLSTLSQLVDGSNFIISDEFRGIVNGDSSFNKNYGYSSGNLAVCPLYDCILSITCEVSSESGYDFGAIYVGDSYYTPSLAEIKASTVPENTIMLVRKAGAIESQTHTTQLNANQTYIISFVYAKDGSQNSNKDRMIITEIKTEPISVEDN